jgi:hypothetical protein
MLVAAYENLCDRIILVSSDTDLIPAVNKASVAMVARCNESHLLKKEDLLPFIKPQVKESTK